MQAAFRADFRATIAIRGIVRRLEARKIKKKATLEERGLLPRRPHFLWDWEVCDRPGEVRSDATALPGGGYLVSDARFGDPIFVYQISHRDRSGVRIVELIRQLFCAATCRSQRTIW